MQEMLGLEQPGVGECVEVDHAFLKGLYPLLVEAQVTDAERIQHRGDAGRGALGVMRHHRRAGRPAGIAARLHLALQIVGMHVDHAGDQVVSLHVQCAGDGGGAGIDRRNRVCPDQDRAIEHAVAQHHPGICQRDLVHAAS
jgi:hypothetical protein